MLAKKKPKKAPKVKKAKPAAVRKANVVRPG